MRREVLQGPPQPRAADPVRQRAVASVAQQPPDLAGAVVVVNVEPAGLGRVAADSAAATLGPQHFRVAVIIDAELLSTRLHASLSPVAEAEAGGTAMPVHKTGPNGPPDVLCGGIKPVPL